MSEPKLISPMLDNFAMGDPISDHNGVRCCPAMENDTEHKYIVKVISVPASQTQLDALLLSGAYADKNAALAYYSSIAADICDEAQLLEKLSLLEGFVPYTRWQTVPMDDGCGYDIYLLSAYRPTLQALLRRQPMTHLGAVNLGLDLCAALAVSRRSGYIYANLKPENVYITGENEFRIGDIGFIKLDSLKYASLPDRYRSRYTAPEIEDAYSSLNTTIDIYSLGQILYQAYNGGTLPSFEDSNDGLVPPAYADYEMAEIIMKACHADPAMRWQDPLEMGQALVSYMQRNGANDTPITPVADEEQIIEDIVEPEIPEEAAEADVVKEDFINESIVDSEDAETDNEADAVYEEDEEGNLTFLSESVFVDPDDSEAEEIAYEEVSEEVSDMLEQADDLIAHPTPDPVVAPEPIDVPIPEPISVEPEPEESADDEERDSNTDDSGDNADESGNGEALDQQDENEQEEEKPAKKSHWLRNTFLALMAVALFIVGFLYYKNYYLQPIESIRLDETESGKLTVYITSKTDESKLTVICSDTYGNQLTSPVQNGKAHFDQLTPNSAYNVRVEINGFHRLTGDISKAFTTPVQTEIVQFNAVTGAEDGSVILGFTIDGPDAEQWQIKYNAEGQAEREVVFSGHMTTLTGLSVGSEYTFRLSPVNDLLISGNAEIKHVVGKVIKAENLFITGCINNTLTASWNTPADTVVESWTVRCYNDNGFDQTVVVNESKVAFEGVDSASNYTLEVTAAGMSVSQRVYAAANAITVLDFNADFTDSKKVTLTWKPATKAPDGGWLLLYSIDGSATQELKCEKGNTAALLYSVPGATYTFTLQAADSTPVLGGNLVCKTDAAEKFSAFGVTADSMEFKMCKTPKSKNWDRYDLKKSDYTTTFKTGQKASFLVKLSKNPSTSNTSVTTLFVIRDENGTIVSTATITQNWKKMWTKKYCELDIPVLPKTAGKYVVSVYFNGSLANEQSFTVTE